MPLQLKKKITESIKENYRLSFEKLKLPIAHKWVDGIKMICSGF
jgi:hypothetical protein